MPFALRKHLIRKYEPRPYQARITKKMVDHHRHGILIEPGLGKTAITLEAYRQLRGQNRVMRMLVIAPLTPLYFTWVGEANKWEQFNGFKLGVLHGSHKRKTFEDESVDIFLINPEGIKWLYRTLQEGIILPPIIDMLVVDESTRFKNPSANRTRTLVALLDLFYRRYILTGYPAPNGYMDLFSQLYLLDQGETLGNNYTTYQRTYFYVDDRGKFSRPRPREGAVNKINKAMDPIISQLTVEDVMQLPKLNHVPIYVRPNKGFLERYERLEKTLVVEMDNVSTAFQLTAATSLMKTRQFVNGFVYDENREPIIVGDLKLKALDEFVSSLGGKPVLIFYVFETDGQRIMKTLNVPVKERIHGGLTHKEKTEIFNRWNDKQIDALICQPSTMAHGSNIQHGGSIIIFFSLMFDFELYYQGYRRLWRSGQKHPTYIYYLQVLDTVDEDIYRAIRGDKTKIYESFINYFKNRATKKAKNPLSEPLMS